MSDFTEVKWVALKNHHGRYLSWAPGGDCRANETNLRTEEKWLMFRNPKTNTCKFGKPIGHGLYQYMSSAGDKKVNCKASWSVGTEWQMEVHGNKYAFKAVGGDYLCNEPPSHSRDRQVLADRTNVAEWELFDLQYV